MPVQIAITSQSEIKKAAIAPFIRPEYKITYLSVDSSDQLKQPISTTNHPQSGLRAARNRIRSVIDNDPGAEYNVIIAMENFIDLRDYMDYAVVIIFLVNESLAYCGLSEGVAVPKEDLDDFISKYPPSLNCIGIYGCNHTYGEYVHGLNPEIPADNWMWSLRGVNRSALLRSCLEEQIEILYGDREFLLDLRKEFRIFSDFPRPNVIFMDWSNIFLYSELRKKLTRYLAKKYLEMDQKVDYVMGLETRGYFLALPLADALNAGFVPLRKKTDKFPPPNVTEEYEKEYGRDSLQLRADLNPGTCIICDDILATGGSALAAINLIKKTGHTLIDFIVLRDVKALRKQVSEKLRGHPLRILLQDI